MAKKIVNVEFGKCSLEKEEERLETESDEIKYQSIRSGKLYFEDHRIDSKHIPFMFASYTIDAKELIDMIFEDWKLSIPRIILCAYSETEDITSDEYRKLSRKLVKGLVHVLNTTEMWLCTDGLNNGFSRDIAGAFERETSRRKSMESSMKNSNTAFPDTALIGICSRKTLTFSHKFDEYSLTNTEEISEVKRDINKRYDYFIFVDDTTETKKGVSHFLLNFTRELSKFNQVKSKSDDSLRPVKSGKIPLIALLLKGKITQIDLILGHLKEGLPLVVIEGSGGLADLLAYTYYQVNYHPDGINVTEYTESVLKPQVSDRIHELYPELTSYRITFLTEKIFACIRYSKHTDQEFITVLNLNHIEFQPYHLPCILLRALVKSKISDSAKSTYQMRKDLLLAMDWNSSDVAREEVFARDTTHRLQIDSEMFRRALTEPQREEFLSLFMSKGFVIHKFLDSENLTYLFQYSLKREFFRSVIWENVLGFGSNIEITRNFLDSKLIILIEELTGIPSLINSYELDWNHRAIYDDRTPEEAERKAVAILTLWAIMSYRITLAKTIWKHSEQPIHLALACSIILRKLGAFVTDLSLKNEMEKQSKEFSRMAVDVMTLCYESVPCRALDLLNEKNRVWSFKALMELAAFAKNKMFLSHPCCQKYLDNVFMGYIRIRDLPYGDITIPLWLKIVLSAFLVFPMFLWVKVELPENFKTNSDSTKGNLPPRKYDIPEDKDQKVQSPSVEKEQAKGPSFFETKYYFWSAPITKFWVCQVFYLFFLLCFSLVVLWPACGNIFLDFFMCIWIGIIILDSIYHAYTLNIKYTSMSLVYKCLEISLLILFVFCYAMGRIIWRHTFMTPYQVKVMLCLALLYFYYRIIFIALPISSELGPMLYRVKRMLTVDFASYMRVTILVIISNGIVIHATIYPDYPLNWELVRRAFYDAIISFFLTPAGHYGEPNPKCVRLVRGHNKKSFIGYPDNECKVGRYLKYECPNPGVWPYIFGLQYFILLRLILVTMLFALFSNTTRKLDEEGKYIWKYQRYELVINFSNRLTLPPPLCIITLTHIFLKYVWKHLLKCMNRYLFKTSKAKSSKLFSDQYIRDKLEEIDFRYWKSLAMKYHTQEKQAKATEMTTKKRMERINSLADALNKQRKSLRDLEGTLNELQIQIKNSHQYIAESGLQVSRLERLHAKNIPQIFSRISPYPDTMISRFPVSDSHVPWKCNWTMYDPISFTLPKEKYPSALRSFVDVDIQKDREIEGETFKMPLFNWNKIFVSAGGVSVDRQSWITDKSSNAFEYELDTDDLPKNPLGRTGLKGRGCLPMWGPNHYVYVLITRWHEKDEMLFHKYLDVILLNTNGDLSLPGGYVYTENRYEVIRSLFQCEGMWKESSDMIAFFDSLKDVGQKRWRLPGFSKASESTQEEITDYFTSERIKLGYMDEETNTDQAWCEADVWHFHYNTQPKIEDKFKANLEWYLMTEDRLMEIPIGQAALLYITSKKMKAILELADS